jgi:hypothetical protein
MRKAMLLLAVFGLVGLAWAADPYVGTWKLNPTKTKVTGSGSADRSATAIIESQENGIKLTFDGVDAAGKPIHMEFAAKYDGKDYSVKGYATIDTVSIRRINNDTHDRLYKKGGKEVLSEYAVASKDGRKGTVTQKGKDEKGQAFTVVTVWEKQ